MEKTTAFGYELENGSIRYILTNNLILSEIEKYIEKRQVPYTLNNNIISISINDYYNKKSFEVDKSNWRVLYLLDGSTICKKWE
jgi:hypothetical protein